jgi:hypothetical protein
MPDRFVLHPAATLIEGRVGHSHHVEGVSDLHGGGEHRVEHGAIRGGQVEGGPDDPGPPRLGLGGEPAARLHRVTTRHDVEQLASADIDDLV